MKYTKSKLQVKKELDLLAKIYKLEQQGSSIKMISEELEVSAPTIRNIKSRHSHIWDKIEATGVAKDDTKMAWFKNEDLSILFYNPEFDSQTISELFENTIRAIREYSPNFKDIKAIKPKGEHCLIVHPTDMHIGKEGQPDIVEQALNKYKELEGMIQPFDIDEIIITSGGDMLHVDNFKNTTTSGTVLETDGTTADEMFEKTLKFYVELIDRLAVKRKVRFINILANHDYNTNYFLSKTLEAWYRNHPNVSFEVSMNMRKYIKFGKNMFAFEHGHTNRELNIAPTIAHEASKMWGETLYRYAFIGHRHTSKKIEYKTTQEVNGLQIEWLKSVAKPDKWHQEQGYFSLPAIQSFVFAKENGEVARYTQYIK